MKPTHSISSSGKFEERQSKNSHLVTDIVIGMSDGLTVPFALAAGLSEAVSNTSIILIAGIAATAAGSIAMGLGGYLAGKSEVDQYHSELRRGAQGVEKMAETEMKDVRRFFSDLGLSLEMQEKATEEIATDKKQWVDFIRKYELGLDRPDPRRAARSALNIGISYAVGGLVPLSPYFFVTQPMEGLKISAVLTLVSLFIFGYFRARITGVNPLLGAIRITIIGALAGAAAFGVASLFNYA